MARGVRITLEEVEIHYYTYESGQTVEQKDGARKWGYVTEVDDLTATDILEPLRNTLEAEIFGRGMTRQ